MRRAPVPKKEESRAPKVSAKPISETLFGLSQKDICRIAQRFIDSWKISSMDELERADQRMHTLVSAMGISRELRFSKDSEG